MGKREVYKSFLQSNSLNDTLSLIKELSYSRKHAILEPLTQKYSSDVINKALNTYHLDYIRPERVSLVMLPPLLIYLCKENI